MSELQHLSLGQTIEKINQLIDSGNGDAGRLYHILEYLKNKKPLYQSDQIYLEHKLNSSFDIDEEFVEDNDLVSKINTLIDSGNGDPGRLQHISDMIKDNKTLYHSDIQYLESKLHPSVSNTHVSESNFAKIPEPKQIEISKENTENVQSKPVPSPKIQGTMPKGWDTPPPSDDLDDITKKIETEEEKIKQQQKISDELDANRLKLSELVSHRKEYEHKVSSEKISLESQINNERQQIETQTRLSSDIIKQKDELAKIKKERTTIIKKINSEKSKMNKDLPRQKRQLAQAQLEQEKLENQIQTEQTLLSKMTEEQKNQLLSQAKIAQDIKLKQIDLEKTKQDYDEIVSQINEEKKKLDESEKLKKLIKSQEQDLIKAKEQRLEMINSISKEREIISKKTQEENNKLKTQSEYSKQLKKDEKELLLLKKKREKTEQQLNLKNKKLKEQAQKLKKQVDEKNKKLKSLKQAPAKKTAKTSAKKTTKTPAKKTASKKKTNSKK